MISLHFSYPILWIIAAMVFALIEALTPQFVTLWFAAGALVSFILALFKVPFIYQVVAFVASSIIFLIITRPLYRKFVKKNQKATNADRLFGQIGIVSEDIDNDEAKGLVKIKGQVWSARSVDGQEIKAGTKVVPVEIDGVKLIVKLAEDKSEENEEKGE